MGCSLHALGFLKLILLGTPCLPHAVMNGVVYVEELIRTLILCCWHVICCNLIEHVIRMFKNPHVSDMTPTWGTRNLEITSKFKNLCVNTTKKRCQNSWIEQRFSIEDNEVS